MTGSPGGIASIETRLHDIRTRFEPPPRRPDAQRSIASGTEQAEFAKVLGVLQARTGGAPVGIGGLSTAGGAFAPPVGRGGDVVEQAVQYLGVPYLWGGTNPDVGLDCSGFVQLVHRNLGIELPRVSTDQARGGQPVPTLADARPGDVLAFGQPVNHVAIYLGDGQMIHAPRRGDVVKIEPIDRPITGIRRYTQSAPATMSPAAHLGLSTLGAASIGAQGTSGPLSSVPYAELFNAAAARHGLDARLLAAVAQVESGFNPTAVSPAGAQGLMQFMPGTAAEMGIDPYDPAQAIDGGARYLRAQLDSFGSLELALAAYNAGPGAVRRHGGIPPFAETQAYVPKVLNAMNGVR